MIVTITILITKSIQEAERVKERVLPQKGIHHRTSAWPAISMIFKDKQNRDHYHMACSKTESACQGGSCGSTSSSPAQKQWKTETKQHLENYFFHIRSCGAEMLTGGGRGTRLSLCAATAAAAAVWAQGLSPCSSGGRSRVAASSSSVVAPMTKQAMMTVLSWCPVAVQA